MATVFLHVGMTGTGSADIRSHLRTHEEQLRARGVSFARAGRDGQTHDALARWIRSMSGDEDPTALQLGRALCEELAASTAAVLSSDRFASLNSHALRNLERLLAGHRVVVVIYLREHLAFWMCKYEQAVVASNLSAAFDTYCQLARAPFSAMVDQFAEVFPRENIRLRSCDHIPGPARDVVQDFALATDCPAIALNPPLPTPPAPRVSGNLLFAKRLLNTFLDRRQGARLGSDIQALAQLEPPQDSFWVDQPGARRVAEMYAADRTRLARRYGLKIEPWVDALGSLPSPDLATLEADWGRLRSVALQQGLPLGRLMTLVSPRSSAIDDAAIAALPTPPPIAAGMSTQDALAALRHLARSIAALEDEAKAAVAGIELQGQIDTLRHALHELRTSATVDLRRQIADYVIALDAARRVGETSNSGGYA